MDSKKWQGQMERLLAQGLDDETVIIQVGEDQMYVRAVTTLESRQKGLGGRHNMTDEGMLFAYWGPHSAPFSRADMLFDIAIYFFDEEGKMIYEDHDSEIAYCPESYTYVLETDAGRMLSGSLSLLQVAPDSV